MDAFVWLVGTVGCTFLALLGAAVFLAAMSRHTDPRDADRRDDGPYYTLTRYDSRKEMP